MKLEVNCPTCQALVEWSELSIYKPFCSERCRLIDLGEWASENHSIAGETVILPDEEIDYLKSND